MDTNLLIVSVITGIIGTSYFFYGKSEQKIIMMLSGVGLCIYPYFIESLGVSIFVGIVLFILPMILDF